jgi:hypothetical protein
MTAMNQSAHVQLVDAIFRTRESWLAGDLPDGKWVYFLRGLRHAQRTGQPLAELLDLCAIAAQHFRELSKNSGA